MHKHIKQILNNKINQCCFKHRQENRAKLINIDHPLNLNKERNNIKNQKKYLAEKKKVKAEFGKAVPFLENARKIKPEDVTNLNLLKTAYYRVGNGAKYKEIENVIKKLNN